MASRVITGSGTTGTPGAAACSRTSAFRLPSSGRPTPRKMMPGRSCASRSSACSSAGSPITRAAPRPASWSRFCTWSVSSCSAPTTSTEKSWPDASCAGRPRRGRCRAGGWWIMMRSVAICGYHSPRRRYRAMMEIQLQEFNAIRDMARPAHRRGGLTRRCASRSPARRRGQLQQGGARDDRSAGSRPSARLRHADDLQRAGAGGAGAPRRPASPAARSSRPSRPCRRSSASRAPPRSAPGTGPRRRRRSSRRGGWPTTTMSPTGRGRRSR